MHDMFKRNVVSVVCNTITVAIVATFGLWLRGEISVRLEGYVTDSELSNHTTALDTRIKRLEDVMLGNEKFQREMIERLARVETELRLLRESLKTP